MYKENNGELFPAGRVAVIEMAVDAVDLTFNAIISSLENYTNAPVLDNAFTPNTQVVAPEDTDNKFEQIIQTEYRANDLEYLRKIAENSAVSSHDMSQDREGVSS